MGFNPDRFIERQERILRNKLRVNNKERKNMAWNRKQIGKISKKTEDRERFPKVVDETGNVIDAGVREFTLQITEDVVLKKGQYINLENKAYKIASLNANRDKMSAEVYEKALEKINKMPDYIVFEVVSVTKE